jgi:hypothetical protein
VATAFLLLLLLLNAAVSEAAAVAPVVTAADDERSKLNSEHTEGPVMRQYCSDSMSAKIAPSMTAAEEGRRSRGDSSKMSNEIHSDSIGQPS